MHSPILVLPTGSLHIHSEDNTHFRTRYDVKEKEKSKHHRKEHKRHVQHKIVIDTYLGASSQLEKIKFPFDGKLKWGKHRW